MTIGLTLIYFHMWFSRPMSNETDYQAMNDVLCKDKYLGVLSFLVCMAPTVRATTALLALYMIQLHILGH